MARQGVRIVCIGEGMLELAPDGSGWTLGHGGDTLNTAIHLARAGLDAAYLTALGTDPFSAELLRKWGEEGLDTALVLTDPAHVPGLYAIATDAAGERSFIYWRDNSAARNLFDLPGIAEALARAEAADLLCFSLISLAILPPPARERLLDLCRRARARGAKVAFDGNYRPRLWSSPDEARHWHEAAIACADIGLPTLDDELALRGGGDGDTIAAAWQQRGCREVVIKLGAAGCRLPGGTVLAPAVVHAPVDTSGAGDAFNAGYLAARMGGATPRDAARSGQRLAGYVVMRRGAIPPVPEWPENSAPSP